MLDEPKCSERNCVHFMGVRADNDDEVTERPFCRAFPNGIPSVIASGDNPHTEPFPGDNGIQYEEQTEQVEVPEVDLQDDGMWDRLVQPEQPGLPEQFSEEMNKYLKDET